MVPLYPRKHSCRTGAPICGMDRDCQCRMNWRECIRELAVWSCLWRCINPCHILSKLKICESLLLSCSSIWPEHWSVWRFPCKSCKFLPHRKPLAAWCWLGIRHPQLQRCVLPMPIIHWYYTRIKASSSVSKQHETLVPKQKYKSVPPLTACSDLSILRNMMRNHQHHLVFFISLISIRAVINIHRLSIAELIYARSLLPKLLHQAT